MLNGGGLYLGYSACKRCLFGLTGSMKPMSSLLEHRISWWYDLLEIALNNAISLKGRCFVEGKLMRRLRNSLSREWRQRLGIAPLPVFERPNGSSFDGLIKLGFSTVAPRGRTNHTAFGMGWLNRHS